MTIIISRTIRKKELSRERPDDGDMQIIIKAFQKGIGTFIKGRNLPENSRLIKIYATTIAGARRIVYLVNTKTEDAFFLFYRTKNDKIGKNVTIQNPEFRDMLEKYIAILLKDIDDGNIDIYTDNKPNKGD